MERRAGKGLEPDSVFRALSLSLRLSVSPSFRLLLRGSEKRKLRGQIEPTLLDFDVVGDGLLGKVRQGGGGRIVIQIQPVFDGIDYLRILLGGEIQPLGTGFDKGL